MDVGIWALCENMKMKFGGSELIMGDIKSNFDIAISMIESGDAEQDIIDDENK